MTINFPSVTSDEEFSELFQSEIWSDVAKQICLRHRISYSKINRAASSDHIVFLIDANSVIKIFRPFRNGFEREKKALEFISGKTDFRVPEIIHAGDIGNFKYIVMTQVAGISLTRAEWLTLPSKEQTSLITKLAAGLKSIHALDAKVFVCDWQDFVRETAETFIERQIAHGVNSQVIASLPAFIENNLPLLPTDCPTVFLHGDVHFGNVRLSKFNKNLEITGLFDFADSRRALPEYDFLAVGILIMQGQGAIQREFFKAYGYAESELDENFRRRLMMLTMLYESSDLRRYALRLKPEAVDYSLEELEKAIWNFAP